MPSSVRACRKRELSLVERAGTATLGRWPAGKRRLTISSDRTGRLTKTAFLVNRRHGGVQVVLVDYDSDG